MQPAAASALVVLIGNSASVWRPFLNACAHDASLLTDPHPLQCYLQRNIETALSTNTTSYRVYWSHCTAELVSGGRGYVAMQRMAECSGLAYLDHTSHLSIHPVFGPWFSLRCAIVMDDVYFCDSNESGTSPSLPPLPPPPRLVCPLDDATVAAVKEAACIAFEGQSGIEKNKKWQKWLAVRDAVGAEHPHRYCERQIVYHYTGDRDALRACVLDAAKSE